MKKVLLIILCVLVLTPCCVWAAKYKVNTSGTVKNVQTGKVVKPQTQSTNYYNNYNATNYANSNQVNAVSVGTIDIVMDYSGSMSNWIGVAKSAMQSIVYQIPDSTKIGFRVFGQDYRGLNPYKATVANVKSVVKQGNKYEVKTTSYIGSVSGACSATAQVTPIQPKNLNALLNGMNNSNIGGSTPLVYALDRAVAEDFAAFDKVSPKKLILVTDGGENCGGDPCEFARQLMKKRNDIHIDVLFVDAYASNFTCLATITGGHVYNVNGKYDFSKVLLESMTSQPAPVQKTVTPQNRTQQYEYYGN